MGVKWIIADIDGCISPEESVSWDLELFAEFTRVCRAAADGRGAVAPLTFCTGRPQPYVECLMKILDVRAPAICENGAVIYDLRDNRSRYAPGITTQKILGLRNVRAFVEREILPAEPRALYQFGKEAQMSVFSQHPEIFPAIKQRIELFVKEAGGPELVINTSHFYLNISLAGADKGATLRLVQEELGVRRDETAGIGDTEGDLPLRDVVGFFACPANARAVVKKTADYVSPYPTLRGVLDILQRPEAQRAGPS